MSQARIQPCKCLFTGCSRYSKYRAFRKIMRFVKSMLHMHKYNGENLQGEFEVLIKVLAFCYVYKG